MSLESDIRALTDAIETLSTAVAKNTTLLAELTRDSTKTAAAATEKAKPEKAKPAKAKPAKAKAEPAPEEGEEEGLDIEAEIAGAEDDDDDDGLNTPNADVTRDDVKAALLTLKDATDASAVKDLLAEYGASRIGDLKEEHWSEVVAKADLLSGEAA